MAEKVKLSKQVNERPLEDWAPIAVEFLGAESVLVKGKRWNHHVIHKGDGPPLLMYHGIGGHAETYARTLPAIAAAGYHVYAVDALYHGYSSKPDLKDRAEMAVNQVDGVVDLIEALGYEWAHFEGESMGAMTRSDLRRDAAARQPSGVNRHPSRRESSDEVIQDAVRHGLVERAFVPKRPQVQLQRLQLDDRLVGHVLDAHRREVGLASHRADARELGRLAGHHIVAARMRIRHRAEVARRRGRHGADVTRLTAGSQPALRVS